LLTSTKCLGSRVSSGIARGDRRFREATVFRGVCAGSPNQCVVRWYADCDIANTTPTLQNMFMTESPVLYLRRLLALAAITAMTGGAFGAPVDGDWPMPAKDYASTRYSTLADIR